MDTRRAFLCRRGQEKDLIEALAKGNFRKTEKLLRRAKMLSEYAKTPINEDVVKEATKMLLL